MIDEKILPYLICGAIAILCLAVWAL